MIQQDPSGKPDSPARAERASRNVTLRGFVIPADGEAADGSLSLLTDDDDEYLLADSSKCRALASYLQKRVIVWGHLDKGEHSKPVLRVSGFELVHWNEE